MAAGKERKMVSSSAPLKYYVKSGAQRLVTPNEGDSGIDLKAAADTTLFPGEQRIIPTGVVVEIPCGNVGLIKDRSSMAMRQIYVHAGVIDASFRGAISVLLQNSGQTPYHIEAGDRIAQMLVMPITPCHIVEVCDESKLSPSKRGEGAFGSTGK